MNIIKLMKHLIAESISIRKQNNKANWIRFFQFLAAIIYLNIETTKLGVYMRAKFKNMLFSEFLGA